MAGTREKLGAGSRWLDRVWNVPVRRVACVMEYELMDPRSRQLPQCSHSQQGVRDIRNTWGTFADIRVPTHSLAANQCSASSGTRVELR